MGKKDGLYGRIGQASGLTHYKEIENIFIPSFQDSTMIDPFTQAFIR